MTGRNRAGAWGRYVGTGHNDISNFRQSQYIAQPMFGAVMTLHGNPVYFGPASGQQFFTDHAFLLRGHQPLAPLRECFGYPSTSSFQTTVVVAPAPIIQPNLLTVPAGSQLFTVYHIRNTFLQSDARNGLLLSTLHPPAGEVSCRTTQQGRRKKTRYCHYCRMNGQGDAMVSSHNTKNSWNQVVCPLLLLYVCSVCQLRGHTAKYCPTLAGWSK